jgi:hypothetical protein
VLVTGSTAIGLNNVTIVPGNGARGSDGVAGSGGLPGGAGGAGGPGVEHSAALFCDNRPLPAPGAAGVSSCGRNGGLGGTVGVGAGSGGRGAAAVGGAPGGAGGASPHPGVAGSSGANGLAGSLGAGGADLGVFSGALYLASGGGTNECAHRAALPPRPSSK